MNFKNFYELNLSQKSCISWFSAFVERFWVSDKSHKEDMVPAQDCQS